MRSAISLAVLMEVGCARGGLGVAKNEVAIATDAGCLPGEEDLSDCDRPGEIMSTSNCTVICRGAILCLTNPQKCHAARPAVPLKGLDEASK